MRLLSYNIHKGIGGRDRRYRLDRILEVIRNENPDLLCLQEVARGSPRSYRDDQPGLLAEFAGARAGAMDYQLNVRWRTGGYGNLLLSRWPIRSHHHVSLRFKGKKPRGAQVAVTDTPEGPLLVGNWHLGLGREERDWQARRLLGHPSFLESAHLPALLAGDFNDWPNALAASLGAAGFSQATAPPWRFRSFPAWLPIGSLDKAYCRGAVLVHGARVVRSRLTHAASDHLPLVVDFALGSG